MTGNFARGTGCCGTTSVDCGLYSRMVGGVNSGLASFGRARPNLPGRLLLRAESARRDRRDEQRTRASRTNDAKLSLQFMSQENVAASRKPNSVPAFARRLAARSRRMTIIPLAPPSLAGSSDLPGDSDGPSAAGLRRGASLFGLAPCGVLPATRVTTGAVRSYRTFSPLPLALARFSAAARRRAVYFLCHFPSGCPDRALPGALPCGVRTFLPAFAPCGAPAERSSGSLRRARLHRRRLTATLHCPPSPLSVGLLRDLILLELLVEVAARRADHFGGLRDVPAVLAQLADQIRALGVVLELAQRPRLRLRRRRSPASARAGPPLPTATARRRADRRRRWCRRAVMMISRSTVLRSSRMLPFQR